MAEPIIPDSVVQPSSFRDSIGTAEQSGERKWVFPKKPKGKLTDYRNIVGYLLLIIFIITPFIKINGNPLLKIDILNREFFILGNVFYPQDFFILTFGIITGLVFIILFTVIYGRIFCGWICPQTIFMEHLFRKIEYLIEGDRNQQKRLAEQAWDTEKIWKKTLKHFVFVMVSFICSHLMFAYVVGYEKELEILQEGAIINFDNFIVMLIFTGVFYFVFSWFREQVCTLVCPYGRLQGVLIDKETINVIYDYKRGESSSGRAKFKRGEDRKAEGKGDCIDCNQCVVVCPTGIDIRNGIQLECINCTACIDACNDVMVKTGFPKGLIRYATENEVETKQKFFFNNRMKAFTVVLLLLMSFLGVLFLNRGSVEAKFIKPAGTTFIIRDGKITNVYNYTFLNKTNKNMQVHVKVLQPKNATLTFVGASNNIKLTRDKLTKGTVNITFPEADIKLSKQNIELGVYDDKGKLLDTYDTYFEGPFQIGF